MKWFVRVMRQYATFTGRAQRAEYWFFVLFASLIALGLAIVENALGLGGGSKSDFGLLSGFFVLAIIIPSVAVACRRLHDTGRSGWWQLINFIPFVGPIVLIVLLVQDSQPGDNRFGPNPKVEQARTDMASGEGKSPGQV